MNSEEAGWLAEGDQASSGYESGPEVGSLASLQLSVILPFFFLGRAFPSSPSFQFARHPSRRFITW
jgi:hypothetical protein